MMKKISLILFLSSIAACSTDSGNISIERIEPISVTRNQTVNGQIQTFKIDNYKVSNFKYDDKSSDAVEHFAMTHLPSDIAEYPSYQMGFFEAVDDSDVDMLNSHPDRFYNQDNIIYDFTWQNGKFMFCTRYKEGKILPDRKNSKMKFK